MHGVIANTSVCKFLQVYSINVKHRTAYSYLADCCDVLGLDVTTLLTCANSAFHQYLSKPSLLIVLHTEEEHLYAVLYVE